MANRPTILVWSDNPALLGELASAARRGAPAGDIVVATVACGQPGPASGVDVLYDAGTSAELTAEFGAAALAAAVAVADPVLVLIGATKLGLQVAPRVAERTSAGYAAWAAGFEVDLQARAVAAHCSLYSGSAMAHYQFKPGLTVLTAAPGALGPVDGAAREPQVVQLSVSDPASAVSVDGVRAKVQSGARLEEAKAVLDVGQGVKARDDLALVQALADLLDGQLACTRPLASDRDWFPEWLGLSGKKVAPEVSVLIGVSGAIQHIVGVRDSRVIAAINNDENAGIFSQADVGVVADLYAFLPVLTERLKARGMRPAWK